MQSELATRSQELPQQVTLMSVIDRILTNNPAANIETIQQMLALQERWEAKQAEKAYNAAFSAFKAEAVTIVRNAGVSDGPLKGKKYADLFGVTNAVIPAMSKHGLSHRWKLTKDEPEWMEVTCVIKHELGHSEDNSMGSKPDTGPGRNAIQARGSAKSYLERYTLLAALGMAPAGQDDDGRGGVSQGLPDEEFVPLMDNIQNSSNDAELKRSFGAALESADRIDDFESMRKFKIAKNKRRAELDK